MPYELDDKLVIGISSRALFDLDEANEIYERDGLEAYRTYQREREDEPLRPGTAFPLIKALLSLNRRSNERLVEVVLISRNDADSGLRMLNSAEHYDLDIKRAALTGGRDPYPYLVPLSCDLFLSANPDDVRGALGAGFAAGLVYPPQDWVEESSGEVRVAFDGDAVLFSDESERVFQEEGLAAFERHESDLARIPMEPGPFKRFLESLSAIQKKFPERECPIRTALITARNSPADRRVIYTLRAWDIRIDESFFLGGIEKARILEVLRPHIFFDDQIAHCEPAASVVPTARVPPVVSPGEIADRHDLGSREGAS